MNELSFEEFEKPNAWDGVKYSSDESPKFWLPFPLSVEVKNCDKFTPAMLTCYLGDLIWKGYDEDGQVVYANWDQVYPVE